MATIRIPRHNFDVTVRGKDGKIDTCEWERVSDGEVLAYIADWNKFLTVLSVIRTDGQVYYRDLAA